MRRGGSKQKGASNERAVCRQLSLWVTHGTKEDVFWRSAMSGGRATVAKRRGKTLASQAGDISAIDPSGHILTDNFYIETKHVKTLALDRFIVTRTGPLVKYWNTACLEAASYQKKPLLIVKQNLLPMLFICEFNTVAKLTGRNSTLSGCLARVYHNPTCEIWPFDYVLAQQFDYVG